jgi:hypothetical protein
LGDLFTNSSGHPAAERLVLIFQNGLRSKFPFSLFKQSQVSPEKNVLSQLLKNCDIAVLLIHILVPFQFLNMHSNINFNFATDFLLASFA